MKTDNIKDATETAVVVGTAVATHGPVAGILTGLGLGAFKLAMNAIGGMRSHAERRARELFERMAESEESSQEFLEHLENMVQQEDESTLAALRLLVTASLDALAPDAVNTIAMFGRQYLRAETPAWIVRAWVRLVTDLSTEEIVILRDLARCMRDALAAGASPSNRNVLNVTELERSNQDIAIFATDARPSLPPSIEGNPRGLVVMSTLYGWSGIAAPDAHRDRFFELLAHHGVASRQESFVARYREGRSQSFPERRPAIELRHPVVVSLIRACVPEAADDASLGIRPITT